MNMQKGLRPSLDSRCPWVLNGLRPSHDSQCTGVRKVDDIPRTEVSAEELAMWRKATEAARNAPSERFTKQNEPKDEEINKK